MNFERKNALIHKIHAWISMAINFLVFSILYCIEENDFSKLAGIIVVFLLLLLFGVSRILYDMHINDISKSSLVFTYVCILLLSCMMIYALYENASLFFVLIALSLVIAEILIVILIYYRFQILSIFNKSIIKRGK